MADFANNKNQSSRSGNDAKKKKKRKAAGKDNGDPESALRTPPKRKNVGSPTKKLKVASTQKKQLEEWSEKAKESQKQFQPGSEEKKGREAKKIIAESTKQIQLVVSNGMWPFVSEVMPSSDGNAVHLMRNEVNHNTISPSLSNEITNNFLGNPIGADRGDKLHDPTMGTDMKCFLTYNEKVSLFKKNLQFAKSDKSWIRYSSPARQRVLFTRLGRKGVSERRRQ